MRKLALPLLAATAMFASPAVAQDNHWYAGVEAGLMWPKDSTVSADFEGDDFDYADIDYKTGFDGDLLAGYDFGMFRLEGELGYKSASHDKYELALFEVELPPVLTVESVSPQDVDDGIHIDADGRTRVWSLMLNGLLDLDVSDRFAVYAGPGIGWHSTRIRAEFDDGEVAIGEGTIRDSGLAWQLIAGARYAVSDNLDLGLKYRYFRTSKLKEDGFEDDYDVRTRFTSHSLLASLIYNFGAPAYVAPPPPPPPPPAPEPVAPATQTCADGSVIMATDMCPAPPPPAPVPERG